MAFASAALLGLPSRPAAAAAYDQFYANFAGEELMRAMNADRAALGLPALATDATLEDLSRDRAITCPSNSARVILGRAKDMATRGYLSHDIPGCTEPAGGAYSAFDLLHTAGYTFQAVGEDIAANSYPDAATSFATGCNASGGGCHGSTTLPMTVAVTERGFMSSSSHRPNILSTTYNRFGCGAWSSSSGNHYFSCYFASGGNGVLDGFGPAITGMSGAGATFAIGSRPTFTASVADAHSVLSDGWAAIDGGHIRNWAWNHAGTVASVSAAAPALAAGRHTFTWFARDASTRSRTASFTFYVGTGPPPTPRPTAPPTAAPAPSHPVPGPGARPSSPPSPEGAGGATAAPSSGPLAPASGGPGASASEAVAGTLASAGAGVGAGNPILGPTSVASAGAAGGAGRDETSAGVRSGDSGAAMAAIALLLLLGVGLVPPAILLARSRRPPGT